MTDFSSHLCLFKCSPLGAENAGGFFAADAGQSKASIWPKLLNLASHISPLE